MLVINETYEQRKAFLLDYIKTCRAFMALLNTIIARNKELADIAHETLSLEQREISRALQQLVELKRWLKAEGIAPDEPYLPRRLREQMKGWTEEQWQTHYDKQLLIASKIDELKQKGGYE